MILLLMLLAQAQDALPDHPGESAEHDRGVGCSPEGPKTHLRARALRWAPSIG